MLNYYIIKHQLGYCIIMKNVNEFISEVRSKNYYTLKRRQLKIINLLNKS